MVVAAMPLPKYHQIYLVLREQLAEGLFASGLPAEMQLVKQFGVARVTVRKALAQLVSEGLISRSPGRGTVPVPPTASPPPTSRAQLTGLLENLVSMGLSTDVRVLSCETVPAPDEVAEALALAQGAPVQKAVRVRSTRVGPLSHITTHVPAALAQGFGRADLERQPILLLLEAQGVHIGRAHQTLGARLADGAVAPLLGLAVGSALLAVNRLVYDDQDRPVMWLQGLYRPDRYRYEMQLSRVGDIDARVWVSRALGAQFQ